MKTHQDQPSPQLADELYTRFAQPLEAEHLGEYVAISSEGRTVLGHSMLETAQRARETLGPGSYLFKIGPKAVGRLR